MKYQVTRTYNGNSDIVEMFDDLNKASEFFFELKAGVTDVRIELEEIK